MKMKVGKIALAMALTAGVVGSSCAGTVVGSPDTKTADLGFVQPADITHTAVALTGFVAGVTPVSTRLADFAITVNTGNPEYIAYRWRDAVSASGGSWVVSGKNNSNNKLEVYRGNESSPTVDTGVGGSNLGRGGWRRTSTPVTKYTYSMYVGGNNQDVEADTYALVMEASLWVL